MATDSGCLRLKALSQQGYQHPQEQLRELEWGLRFTPTVCMLAAVMGLVLQQWPIHALLAVLGIGSFWLPSGHPLDHFYNLAVRPLWNGVSLPPSPLPRRIACLIGGVFNAGIAVSFLTGLFWLAYLLGAVLVPLQVLVITIHFCVASWMYEIFMGLLGRRVPEIELERASRLLKEGARLVDVRPSHQYLQDHIPGALSIPLTELPERLEEVGDGPVIFYCQAGVASRKATRLLWKQGFEEAYNLGSLSRGKRLPE